VAELSDIERAYLLEAVRHAGGPEHSVSDTTPMRERLGLQIGEEVPVWRKLEEEGYISTRGALDARVATTGFWLQKRGIAFGEENGVTKGEAL
jgi:hypothetical protein